MTMFILSRSREESVIVDGFNSPKRALKVTVLEIKGGRVKLGFEVNADAPVDRSQAWNQIRGGGGLDHGRGGPVVFGA
jgi:sRNA-binding carbon storage regulator CsrA